MAHDKIVTVFDTRQQAEAAERNLEKAGFHERDINLIMGEDLRSEGEEIRNPSIWRRLFGETVNDEDAAAYMHAIDIGGVVLTIRTKEEDTARAMTILNMHQTVDVPADVPSAAYRSDLETVNTTDRVAPTTNEAMDASLSRDVMEVNDRIRGDEPLDHPDTHVDALHHPLDDTPVRDDHALVQTPLTGDESKEEIIRLAEEQLEVGKRLIAEGSTRVRRYVTERDVEAEVTLRDEHADIFRRGIGDPISPDEIDWSDKVVEVTETREQPVINKTAKVVEEVVVRKTGTERVEKVNDTVRRQEVEIDRVNSDGDAVDDTAVDPDDLPRR